MNYAKTAGRKTKGSGWNLLGSQLLRPIVAYVAMVTLLAMGSFGAL